MFFWFKIISVIPSFFSLFSHVFLAKVLPYKKYFNKYFSNKNIVKRDSRPIIGLDLAYPTAPANPNDRGYNFFTNLGKYGFSNRSEHSQTGENFTNRLKSLMLNNNYSRVMLWTMGGEYYYEENSKRDLAKMKEMNIPPQFMSNIPQKVESSLEEFKETFNQSNIDFGFWWGRSGQIPVHEDHTILSLDEWNPEEMIPFELTNNRHKAFAKNELKLASQRGVKEIGLDAFTHIKPSQQLPWIREMKKSYPQIKFWEESVVSDYLQT